MEYRSPLAGARGLGAAHHGSGHWWRQRITALALLPLGLWFLFCLAKLPESEFAAVRDWFRNPLNSAVALAFSSAALYHAALGLQVILEDYLHTQWLKLASLLLMKSLLAVAWLTATLAILRLWLGH